MSDKLNNLAFGLFWFCLTALVATVVGVAAVQALGQDKPKPSCTRVALPVVVNLDDIKHRDLIQHERDAVTKGQPRQLTLERDGADKRRKEDLRGIPTRKGFDRDEYPPAFTEESGTHTDGRPQNDVAYVDSSENRSGGSVMGRALKDFCDGQRFVIEAGSP